MLKLKNITDLSELSANEIDLLIGKNFVHLENEQNTKTYTESDEESKTNSVTYSDEDDNDFENSIERKSENNAACSTKQVHNKKHYVTVSRKPKVRFNINSDSDVPTKKDIITSDIGCPYCKTDDSVVTDIMGGMMICTNCGHILESSMLDHSPEWKNYDDGPSVGRCGLPTNTLLPLSSMGTTIRGSCNYRLKTLHNWALMPYKERSLNSVLTIIKKKCDEAGLIGRIADDAKVLYNNAHKSKNCKGNNIIIRGKNRIGLMAACVFYACKRCGCTKSLKEISELFDVKPSCVNKGCKNFVKYVAYMNIDYNTNISHPSQYVAPFCEKLKMNKKLTNMILSLTNYVQENNIVPSHTPISVAAACILMCVIKQSISNIDKRLISTTFGISEVTLMKAYNKIVSYCEHMTTKCSISDILKQTCDNTLKYSKKDQTVIQQITTTPVSLLHRRDKINNIDINKYLDLTTIKLHKFVSCDIVQHNIDISKMCISHTTDNDLKLMKSVEIADKNHCAHLCI